jgi:hypothetical protein
LENKEAPVSGSKNANVISLMSAARLIGADFGAEAGIPTSWLYDASKLWSHVLSFPEQACRRIAERLYGTGGIGSPHDPLGLSAEPAGRAAMFIRETGSPDQSGHPHVHRRPKIRPILCRKPKGRQTGGTSSQVRLDAMSRTGRTDNSD